MAFILTKCYKPYHNTIHSSTQFKPIDAMQDGNAPDVKTNLILRHKFNRSYKDINVGDEARVFYKRNKHILE